ncbi:hypothetical protein SCUP515_00884 [Seiridium cupressi]
MEPVTALGIASGVVQLVDFASRLISKGYRVGHSIVTGEATDDVVALGDITSNLQELTRDLKPQATRNHLQQEAQEHNRNRIDRLIVRQGKRWMRNAPESNRPEEELERLRRECNDVSQELLGALGTLMIRESEGKWKSFRQALGSVWKQREIQNFERQLERIRSKLDTTLLMCLRKKLESLPPDGNPQSPADMKKVFRNCEQWHADLLFEAHRDDWRADNHSDMLSLATRLDGSARVGSEARFCRLVRRRLKFTELFDREQNICEAHQRTFNWLFKSSGSPSGSWDNYSEWLQQRGRSSIYWITGKAGSGKSTLMKYLYRDPGTLRLLKSWSAGADVTVAAFFFWNSGTKMQMSHSGLLRSLIFQMLEGHPKSTFEAFKHRWELYFSFCGGLQPWTLDELRMAFENLISDRSKHWFFIIDGLDEFDGDHGELTSIMLAAGRQPNVKICVASRPWLVFGDAFEGRPSLLMETLSSDDIRYYVVSSFDENQHYRRLQRAQPQVATALVNEIVKKAAGVFLWVYLVVQSLLSGLSNSDHISSLQTRLDAIPPGLEELFSRMMGNLDPSYFSHACQLIQIVEAAREPLSLLGLSFADEYDATAAMLLPVCPLTDEDAEYRTTEMARRLNSRCKGLLEAPGRPGRVSQVQYLHRTARDFVRDPSIWEKIVEETPESFDPNLSLLQSSLCLLKIQHPKTMKLDHFWRSVSIVLQYADHIRDNHEAVAYAYVDAMDRAAVSLTTAETVPNTSWLKGYTLPSQPQHWTSTGPGCLQIGSVIEYGLSHPSPALAAYARCWVRDNTPLDRYAVGTLLRFANEKEMKRLIYDALPPRKPRGWC